MLIPYSLPLRKKHCVSRLPAWDDPVRSLYPHHAEFWPQQIPEHVRLLKLGKRLARKRRRLAVMKFLRMCLGHPHKRKRPRSISEAPCGNPSGKRATDRGCADQARVTVSPAVPAT